MAQYNGKAIILINDVCRDYFPHLTPTRLLQKISAGEIALPDSVEGPIDRHAESDWAAPLRAPEHHYGHFDPNRSPSARILSGSAAALVVMPRNIAARVAPT